MTGMTCRSSSSFSHLVTSRPDTSGSWISIENPVGAWARQIERLETVARAHRLVAACFDRSRKSFMLSSLSSTIITFLAICFPPTRRSAQRLPGRADMAARNPW